MLYHLGLFGLSTHACMHYTCTHKYITLLPIPTEVRAYATYIHSTYIHTYIHTSAVDNDKNLRLSYLELQNLCNIMFNEIPADLQRLFDKV